MVSRFFLTPGWERKSGFFCVELSDGGVSHKYQRDGEAMVWFWASNHHKAKAACNVGVTQHGWTEITEQQMRAMMRPKDTPASTVEAW